MKKLIIAAILFLLPVVFVSAGEITRNRVFGLDDYITPFIGNARQPSNQNAIRVESHYYGAIEKNIFDLFCALEGRSFEIDTTLELVLASFYSPALVQIRPPQAAQILPADNRESPLKLASAILHRMPEVRFFTPQDTAAIGRYEGMIRFIEDRHGLTRAEIDNYYRTALRTEVRKVVDNEFNKIYFSLDNNRYHAVLIRNPQNGHLTLRYTDSEDNTKELSAAPERLSSVMSRSRDFSQAATNTVLAQAALIPAVTMPAARDELVNLITNFYLNPGENTADAIGAKHIELHRGGDRGQAAASSLRSALHAMHPELVWIVGLGY